MKRLFISRDLQADSPFPAFAKAAGLDLQATSLLEFLPVQFQQVPTSDWLFFYSPNGVKFFFRSLLQRQEKVTTPIATLGLGTLNALKEFGKSADFAGNGQPAQVAEAFASLAEGQRVLFVRAQRSRKSIQTMIADQVEVLDLVVYANAMRNNITLEAADYLIFTSPMNVQAYAQKYDLTQAKIILAIGETTASALQQAGAPEVYIAKRPDESALLNRLKEVLDGQ